jgi:hypothetical protein
MMTAVSYDEVVTAAPARKLTVVRDAVTTEAPAPQKVTHRVDTHTLCAGGDPLFDGAARLLSIPMRHVYAALWRAGVLDVRV